MQSRYADWRNRLYDFIESRKDMPFEWGSNDCCLFACDAFHSMTGHDIGAPFRGQYDSRDDAFQFLRNYSGAGLFQTLEMMAREMGAPEVASIEFGDIACVRVVNLDQEAARLAGGITVGVGVGDRMVMIPGKDRCEIMRYPHAVKIWRPLDYQILNWEVVMGCDPLTTGCDSCPSMWEAHENEGVPGHRYEQGYGVRTLDNKLGIPRNTEKPTLFNVAFGSDLFHEKVPEQFIRSIFNVIVATPQHLYDLATKRAERLALMAPTLPWPENLRVGVSIESGEYKHRIDLLRQVPARHRFLSLCPLLGPMGEMNLEGMEAVGVVPETWGLKRPCDPQWIGDIARQCREQDVIMLGEYYLYHDLVGA